jgi:hypothetical protein
MIQSAPAPGAETEKRPSGAAFVQSTWMQDSLLARIRPMRAAVLCRAAPQYSTNRHDSAGGQSGRSMQEIITERWQSLRS